MEEEEISLGVVEEEEDELREDMKASNALREDGEEHWSMALSSYRFTTSQSPPLYPPTHTITKTNKKHILLLKGGEYNFHDLSWLHKRGGSPLPRWVG